MGTNINLKVLKEERLRLADQILLELDKWDEKSGNLEKVFRSLDASFEDLKKNSVKLCVYTDSYDPIYEEKLGLIVEGYELFLEALRMEKEKQIESLKQLNDFQHNGSGYVTQMVDPMFIDKGL